MILDLGLIDYEEAYRIQKGLVRRRKLDEIEDSIMLCEHNAVFTIGRTGRKENLLVNEEVLRQAGIKIVSSDRGGDITFHGPGQLIAYPIIDLARRGRDLHQYLRSLEEVAILFLKEFGVLSQRITGRTGVWAGDRKIASIGIAATNWVTFHGLSININCDLGYFSWIHPCGIRGAKTTSLAEMTGSDIGMDRAKKVIGRGFADIFKLGEGRTCSRR